MVQNNYATTSSSSNTTNVDPITQNASSPYYLHPSDGPSSVAITPVLSDSVSNYHSYAWFIRRALGGKNKFEFMNGSIEIHDSSGLNFKAWSRCNMLIHSWIMNSIAKPISQSIVFLENVINVWEELRKSFIKVIWFEFQIYSMRFMVWSKDHSLWLSSSLNLKLWEEWDNYMPMLVCGCHVKCTLARYKKCSTLL